MSDRPRIWKGKKWILNSQRYVSWLDERPDAPIFDIADLADTYRDRDAFIVCPGPSIEVLGERKSEFDGKLTMAVNSAGLWFQYPRFWAMAEGWYIKFVAYAIESKRIDPEAIQLSSRDIVTTLRSAVQWLLFKIPCRKLYATRFEEESDIRRRGRSTDPTIQMAMRTFDALGVRRIIVFGMDLTKLPGKPYVPGIPVTRRGIKRPYSHQVKALSEMKPLRCEVLNTSPHSANMGLPFKSISIEDGMDILSKSI